MLSISHITLDRWSDLLTSLSQNQPLREGEGEIVLQEGKRKIKVSGILLSDLQLVQTTYEKVWKEPNPQYLEKIKEAINNLIQQKKNALSPPSFLSRFSINFVVWARHHQTLAKILYVVTFGFFFTLWNRGKNIVMENMNGIDLFQQLLEKFKQKENIISDQREFCLPKEILGLVLDYLPEPDREIFFNWMPAKIAMQDLDQQKYKLLESYQTQCLEILDEKKFEKEIKLIKNLKNKLSSDPTFNKVSVPLSTKEGIIRAQFIEILHLGQSQISKKFKDLLKIKFFALVIVQNMGPCALLNVPKEMIDREMVLKALHKKGLQRRLSHFQGFIPDSLLNDEDLLLKTLVICPAEIHRSPLKNNREFILKAVKKNVSVVHHLDESMRKNKEFMLAAINQTQGRAYDFGHPDLAQDEEIILAAISNGHYSALILARNELKNNKPFILNLVKKNGYALYYASSQMKKDLEVCTEAVKQNGDALSYVDVSLHNDLIELALKTSPSALKYATDKYKNNRNLVLELIQKCPDIFRYVSAQLKDDEEIARFAVRKEGQLLACASKRLMNNKTIVLEAVQQNPRALMFAGNEITNDKNFILELIQKIPVTFYEAPQSFKKDKELILKLMDKGINCFGALANFKHDRDFILKASKMNGYALGQASETLQSDRNFVLQILKLDLNTSRAFQFASQELRRDEELALEAVKQDGLMLVWGSPEIKDNKKVVLAAVTQNDYALRYASNRLQNDPEVLAACEA